jgi:hypothetical protein
VLHAHIKTVSKTVVLCFQYQCQDPCLLLAHLMPMSIFNSSGCYIVLLYTTEVLLSWVHAHPLTFLNFTS